MSKGEELIASILMRGNLSFEREKTYDDLRGGRYRFDFYAPARGLIEVDGEQHFTRVKAFHKTEREWLAALEHDRRKNSYALAHNIPLYRIPYWDLPTLRDCQDLFQSQYRVKNRYHNDDLIRQKEKNS